MDKKQIEEVKQILTDWNPLGARANQVSDLANYETKAIDILFQLDKITNLQNIDSIVFYKLDL